MIVYTIIAVAVSTLVFVILLALIKRKAGGTISQDIEKKSSEIKKVIEDTKEQIDKVAALGSKAQYENLVVKLEETKTNLTKEKENLKAIEAKLVTVQKTVEEKEAHHQTMKTSKEEDENKLAD